MTKLNTHQVIDFSIAYSLACSVIFGRQIKQICDH